MTLLVIQQRIFFILPNFNLSVNLSVNFSVFYTATQLQLCVSVSKTCSMPDHTENGISKTCFISMSIVETYIYLCYDTIIILL